MTFFHSDALQTPCIISQYYLQIMDGWVDLITRSLESSHFSFGRADEETSEILPARGVATDKIELHLFKDPVFVGLSMNAVMPLPARPPLSLSLCLLSNRGSR